MAQDFSNYINTYKGSSVLQNQFPNMNDYLALFGYNQGTTPSSTTTSTTPSTPSTSSGVQGIINQNINQYQGGGGDGLSGPPPGPTDPYAGLGYSSANFGLGNTAINKDAVFDYEADAYEVGRTLPGQLSKFGVGIFNAFKNIPTPFNLMRKAYEFTKQKELEKKAQEEAIARDIARDMQEANRAGRTGGYQAGYDAGFMDGPSGAGTGNSPSDKGGSDSMGSFARGGSVKKKKGKSLLDFIDVQASGSKSGKQQIQGAPEGITIDNESINAIIKADIPLSEKINLLASYGYNKDRSKVEKDNEELFLGEGGYKDRNIGLGFNKDGEGIGGTLIYNLETGEPELKIGFKKKFNKGGLATMFKLKG